MRLFVSVSLDELVGEVADIQEPFVGVDGLRTTNPEQAHLTLKFLGETEETRLRALTDGVDAAIADTGIEPFEVSFGGLGVFPHLNYIRVIWLGVRNGSETVRRLHTAIEKRVTKFGFEPANSNFTPHVTLARMDHAGNKELVKDEVRQSDPDGGTMTVEAIQLTKSTLTEQGPEYTAIERFNL
ncbi:RNA 2',3'-cyclic phosphodiesterase [Halovenus rubra]|uniref:RNA 2',3'-cyclic phosphodiesterase n=2 Tax=Halovenus rubra TaxID=869890 RepID=A0ACC7E1W7_9EURY|nr:RNA 2',3'-cyclic phosphodiesterase [Halovenus rubra]